MSVQDINNRKITAEINNCNSLYILKFVFEKKSRLKLRTVTTKYSEKLVCRQHSIFLSPASLLY